MTKARVLYISQEITPFLPETPMSNICRHLPQYMQEHGKEIRTFMPRYGCVNERRHQLHEVIRLSGMNIIIDDTDHPLIIKVASIQPARMQVYFIENEEYFHRKSVVSDAETGKYFDDNDERIIFFSRGVLETVRKLGWAPDIIHCQGWITSIVPLLIKKMYADDPLFAESRVIYSVYGDSFKGSLDKNFGQKLMNFDGIVEKDIPFTKDPNYLNISKMAVLYSDAITISSKTINSELLTYISNAGKPVMKYKSEEDCIDAYDEFYEETLEECAVFVG